MIQNEEDFDRRWKEKNWDLYKSCDENDKDIVYNIISFVIIIFTAYYAVKPFEEV